MAILVPGGTFSAPLRNITALAWSAPFAASGTLEAVGEIYDAGQTHLWTDLAQQVGDFKLKATLTDDTWANPLTTDMKTALIAGLSGSPSGTTGFNAEIKSALAAGDVSRFSDTEIRFSMGFDADVLITTAESITLTAPANTLNLATNASGLSPASLGVGYLENQKNVGVQSWGPTSFWMGDHYHSVNSGPSETGRIWKINIGYYLSDSYVASLPGGIATYTHGTWLVANSYAVGSGPTPVTKYYALSFGNADANDSHYEYGNGGVVWREAIHEYGYYSGYLQTYTPWDVFVGPYLASYTGDARLII
jgi:hypothetical protein